MSFNFRMSFQSAHYREFLIAGVVGGICFIVALTGFFFIPPSLDRNSPRILFSTSGGQVLFPHRHHFEENGGAFDCADCHHNEGADTVTMTGMECRACHYGNPDIVETVCADDGEHPRCIGRKCLVCHDGEDCTFCHRKTP
ncbi:MAG: cytochrome c3 family protein [Chitinispirillaceae bacterium]|nr:cytochrome c3 family protein [Chitinispirillaceae bacterium]